LVVDGQDVLACRDGGVAPPEFFGALAGRGGHIGRRVVALDADGGPDPTSRPVPVADLLAADEGPAVLLLTGASGAGKTTEQLALAHAVARGDGPLASRACCWVDCGEAGVLNADNWRAAIVAGVSTPPVNRLLGLLALVLFRGEAAAAAALVPPAP
jgi:hypothetical protein